MFIECSGGDSVSLRDADNFRELSVHLAASLTSAERTAALTQLGTIVDDDHVSIAEARLREMAGARGQHPEWQTGFEAMIAFARQHGWVTDDGVRVHVETAPPGGSAQSGEPT